MATTIRISDKLHQMLKQLAQEQNRSMQEILEEILEQYRREWILRQHNQAYANLSSQQWEEEQQERRLWENTLGDGLEE